MARSFFLFLFVRLADVTCFPSISLQNNKVTQAITSIQHLCLLSKRARALLSFAAAEQSLKMLLKAESPLTLYFIIINIIDLLSYLNNIL